MVTDTVNREIERAATELGIPLGMALLYEEQPANRSLVLELSDYLRDRDDEQGADCLRWVAEKGRHPRPITGWNDIRWGWNRWSDPGMLPHWLKLGSHAYLPWEFSDTYNTANGRFNWAAETTSLLLLRAVLTWRLLSPEQTAAAWNWEPPQ